MDNLYVMQRWSEGLTVLVGLFSTVEKATRAVEDLERLRHPRTAFTSDVRSMGGITLVRTGGRVYTITSCTVDVPVEVRMEVRR